MSPRSVTGRPQRRVRTWAGAALLMMVLALTSCIEGPVTAEVGSPRASPSTRPAAKVTCPDVAWNPPPSVHLEQSSRELVPFSPTLLGVHSTWRGDGFTVETVSGGYVDDLTEAYDNLQVTGTLPLRSDPGAQVLHGSLQGSPVLLVLWRDRSQAVPCDVHVFLVLGADPATEELLLGGLGGQ